jgi:hypothetical protein
MLIIKCYKEIWMALSNTEKQEAYRNRMYARGYKKKSIWVPKDSEGIMVKAERKAFMAKLEEFTVGWSKAKLSKFLSEVLKIINKKIKEGT